MPMPGVVTAVYGSWKAARAAAAREFARAGDGKPKVGRASFLTTRRPDGRSSPIADRTRTTVQDRAAQIGIHGPKPFT